MPVVVGLLLTLCQFSRDVLKEDFRIGMKELDDASAEEKDPDNFDPTLQVRGMFFIMS